MSKTSDHTWTHGVRQAGRGVPRRPVEFWGDWPLGRKGLLVAAIPAAPLLLTSVLDVIAVERQETAQRLVIRTHEVNSELAAALAVLLDAESNTRGYLITSESEKTIPVVVLTSSRAEGDLVRAAERKQHG